MTNELEKQFFDTFGIEPKTNQVYGMQLDYHIEEYPQLTDSMLLELICIDNQENVYKCRPLANNVEELKTYILEEFIRLSELGLFKRAHQVRTLFVEWQDEET